MLRRSLILALACILLAPVPISYAQGGESPEIALAVVETKVLSETTEALPVSVSAWFMHELQTGEELSCLARRGGMSWEAVAAVNRLLNPNQLSPGQVITIPQSAFALKSARAVDTALGMAVKHGIPLWQLRDLNPGPFIRGQAIILPGDSGDQLCTPYPLISIDINPRAFVTGRTSLVMLETSEPATCELTFLGQTEPCYSEDGVHQMAFVALPALMEPGDYHLRVRIQPGDQDVAFDYPVTVQAGHYGYQRINPPAGLQGLMDPELMTQELDYLSFWRLIRLSERHWQFPLDFPLPFNVSISAGFGDRRSYGGIVDGYHSGIDYRAWTGVPVLAPADGVVIFAEKLAVRGNALLINHGWGVVTGYWHLSAFDVMVGQHVTRGQQVARVGNTGLSTGSHLHWELWVNGVSVDPSQWLDPSGLGDVTFPDPP